eukprot:6520014-Prorocentrum_lima.AAC.1
MEDLGLRKGLIAFVRSHTQMGPLTDWMQSVAEINQNNLCALLRQLLKTYPGHNMTVASLKPWALWHLP